MDNLFNWSIRMPLSKGLRMSARRTAEYQPYRYVGFSADTLSSKPIRILELHPGEADDDIKISLRKIELTSQPPPDYEALSYVWGNEPPSVSVTVDGNSSLKISPNLDLILRHLRDGFYSRTLWIDAICINQEDRDERAQQVSQMGDLYRMASKVVVWLGPEENNSRAILEYIRRWTQLFNVDWQMLTTSLTPDADPEEHAAFVTNEYRTWRMTLRDGSVKDVDVGDAISRHYRRPWFERVWIRQEIFLARPDAAVVQCGFDIVSWDALRKAAFLWGSMETKFYSDDLDPEHAALNLMTLTRLNRIRSLGAGQQPLGFMTTLHEARWASCTDPRDRVYGALSLVDPRTPSLVEPDYTISTAKLYQIVATRFFNIAKHLNMVLFAGIPGPDSLLGDQIPTWAPDWTTSNHPGPLGLKIIYFDFHLALPIKAAIIGERTLRASGVLVSRIVEYPPSPEVLIDLENPSTLTPDNAFKAIWDMFPDCERTRKTYRSRQKIAEAYCRALFGGWLRDRFELLPSSMHEGALSLEEAMETMNDILRTSGRNPNRDLPPSVALFMRGIQFLRHKIAITDDGRVALVPKTAEMGDFICVFPRCSGALVIRPTTAVDEALADHRDTLRLVGSTYADGVMNGEALLGPLPDGWAVRWRQWPGDGGGASMAFVNLETGEMRRDDPRLGLEDEDSPTWQEAADRRHEMTPERLRERGIDIRELDIV